MRQVAGPDGGAGGAAAQAHADGDLALLHHALAIGFLHSYRDGRHEQRAREIVRALHPDLAITLSSEVAPEIREFERTSTAALNAVLQPVVGGYLEALDGRLRRRGWGRQVLEALEPWVDLPRLRPS